MIAHAANTDVRTFAPFVLWSKLFCNKDQFSRLNQNFSKTDVPKNLPCLYRSSFTKTLWHQSASLIAICPTALPIIHCGIDPQREWESLEKIGLFCFLVYYCSNVSFPTWASFTVIYVEKRQRGPILPWVWIVTEIVVVHNTGWRLDWCLLHILVWRSHGVTTPTCWHPVPTDLHSGTQRTQLLRSTTVLAAGSTQASPSIIQGGRSCAKAPKAFAKKFGLLTKILSRNFYTVL